MRARMIVGEKESFFDIPNDVDLQARFFETVQAAAAELACEAEMRNTLSFHLAPCKSAIDESFAQIAAAVGALKEFHRTPEIS
ncbi:MAG: hypothetical protein DI626_06700 [Micavibrio aeruginosavorus]|uniref:Uncharacterized protein n=1 Tax=Micavibrio aeruginosavorus TaxID=349221 RepID=A0A2W5BT91_9BACT|nr:MAG: hypothetical protein DI626_06700 [Micavibrio aeruginosavorus]